MNVMAALRRHVQQRQTAEKIRQISANKMTSSSIWLCRFGLWSLLGTIIGDVSAWQQQQHHRQTTTTNSPGTTRRDVIQSTLATAVVPIASMVATTMTSWTTSTMPTMAMEVASNNPDVQSNLSNDDLATRIASDVQEKQFLVTGNLSRELYDESATFTDEIDTYTLTEWTKGTAKLFVGNKSHVDLEPNTLQVSSNQVTFRFSETLCFNIPVLYPVVYLSGKVILQRDPTTGLITSYQEQWDQDVSTVLSSVKLFG
jgi:hypothetical protein